MVRGVVVLFIKEIRVYIRWDLLKAGVEACRRDRFYLPLNVRAGMNIIGQGNSCPVLLL